MNFYHTTIRICFIFLVLHGNNLNGQGLFLTDSIVSETERLCYDGQYEATIDFILPYISQVPKDDNGKLLYAHANFLAAQSYSMLNDFKESVNRSLESLLLITSIDSNSLLIPEILSWLQEDHRLIGSYQQSLSYGDKALRSIKKIYPQEKIEWIPYLESNTKTLFGMGAKYSGIEHLDTALNIIEENGLTHSSSSSLYLLKAIYEKNNANYAEALINFNRALKALYVQESYYPEDYSLILSNLANTYKNLNQLDSAVIIHFRGLKKLEEAYGQGSMYEEPHLVGLSNTFAKLKEVEKTEIYGNKAIRVAENTYGKQSRFYIENVLSLINNLTELGVDPRLDLNTIPIEKLILDNYGKNSNIYHYYLCLQAKRRINDNDLTDAISLLDEALSITSVNDKDLRLYDPTVNLDGLINNISMLIDSYFERFNKERNIEDLILSDQYSRQLFDLFVSQRALPSLYESKRLVSTQYRPLIEKSIDIQHELKTNQLEQYDPAFVFSLIEFSKSIGLSESYQRYFQLQVSGLSKAVKQRIEDLNTSEFILFEQLRINNLSIEKRDSINRKLDSLLRQKQSFETNTINKKPNLLNYADKYFEWQKNLNDEMIADYIVFDSSAYVFYISKRSSTLTKIINHKSLKNKLFHLHDGIRSGDSYNGNDIEALYESLLKPGINIDSNLKTVTILPDKYLHFLPFELLLIEAEDEIHKKDITIGYRYHSYSNPNKKEKQSPKFLVYAPKYEHGSDKVKSLPSIEKELSSITDHFSAKIRLGHEASKRNFIEEASLYPYIHLSMHTVPNDDDPFKSSLLFESENGIEVMDILDIYQLPLSADLVTLSACKTGVGPELNGSGLQSLGFAFSYAGAKAQIISLWDVPESSTSKIMGFFYQYFQNGYSARESLKLAKSDYLLTASSSLLKHPLYWAGLVFIGDDTYYEKPLSLMPYSFLVIGFIIVMIIILKKIR